ncbi:uncharacterized protein [Apostichopus japonicus]|uniref:uncharacterized protein isoform X6 n=1 Tax=Stichopus japonicus TaxID=307972 RepID=UPI003AB18006
MALYNHCMRVFSNLPLGVTPLVLEDHCQSPVEGGEEALFQLVERWDSEEPTSPILFDPDGDFILLPRPEQVCFQEKEAFSSLAEPTPFPVHVFVHSAVLNTLQSVPDYPHRFQVYLKEGLSNLKSSKVSEGQTISSTPSSKEQGTEPQTVSEAEPITTNDTPLLRSPTETGWFRSFNTKTSSLKRTKETASADTENPLDTVSDSAREVSVPLKGGDFLEEDEKASAVSDSDLTLDAHGDDLTDGIKNVLRVSKKKTKPPDEPFPEETSGSLISTIGHFFIPSQLGKHFKSTDSLPPLERSQEPDQDLKHDTFSSDQDADISSALDKSVEEDGSDYDECQIGQEEEIKEEVKGQAQEEGWMRHPILLFKPNTYRTLVNKTLSWKGKSQSLDNLSDPVIATFNVTSHKQKNPQDDVNLLEDSTDESEQITDLEFEHLQDVFSAAKAVPKIKPSKLKFWQLVPYVYLGTIKPNNTEHGLKKATSLDSVVSEPLSPSIPVHEEEGVNFVDTNDNFKKFIIGNQRLHIDVDRLKRFATTGMAEGISSSGQSGTDVKSGGILGFVRGAGGRLSALGLSRKSKGHGSAATANGSKSDAQNSLKQNESGLQPTSSIDLDGKTLDIAATNDSLARAQSYQHQVDSKRLKKEWSSTRDDVESFVGTAAKSLSDGYGLWKLGDQDDDREDSILTSHWEKSKNHKNCQGCQTSFSALARFRRSSKRGHCRKCGQVFCNGCLGYMRKLNTFAQYDPSGKECKVCKHCHNPETAPVTEGMTSSHLELFKKHRDNFKHYGWDIELASEQYRFEPTVSSMLRQCKKLEKGFQGSVSGKSGLKVPNLALMKKNIPDWQKPPTWVDPSNKDITGCQLCSRSKLLPGSLHNCRICGRRVCSQDSSSDFLLYIPDRGTVEYSPENSTRWKIIRIVGCPQTEPAICMYLRVCFTCKGKLSTLQEETFQHFRLSLSDEYELCMLMLQGIHKETQQMKSSILECMPKFIDAVDMLGKDSKNITETQRKSLANHQDNLMEQFPKFIMAVDKLRDITPKTEQQVRLVRNVLQEKWAFYRDNVANFRIRGRQLMEIMPEEEIKQLKYIVNREAINCACLIVTQLAFEVLHISMQRNLSESFAMTLKDIGEIIEQELKQMITSSSSGESWEDHRENLYDFVKDEMKSDRRFLKLTAERGEGIERFIYKECERRILSTILQLDAKSSSRSFKKSKQALQSLLAECHNKLT